MSSTRPGQPAPKTPTQSSPSSRPGSPGKAGGVETLAAFYRARLNEEDATARAVLWDGSGNRASWSLAASATVDVGTEDFCTGDRTIANHVVDHDPEHILVDVNAKRTLLDDLIAERHLVVDGDCWYTCPAATEKRDGGENCDDDRRGGPCDCGLTERTERRLRILIAPYAQHPEYQETWRP